MSERVYLEEEESIEEKFKLKYDQILMIVSISGIKQALSSVW